MSFVLGAVFAWLWLRRLGGRWWTAALGAAFVVAGPYASLWRWHTPEQVFALMPLALFFLEWLLQTGSKRHWLYGLVAGVALGVALGFTMDVDPVACEYDYDYACSRGEAVAYGALGFGAIGAGIGALVKTDRWTPVALDALAPPPARVSGLGPHLRARPRGGVELGLSVGF